LRLKCLHKPRCRAFQITILMTMTIMLRIQGKNGFYTNTGVELSEGCPQEPHQLMIMIIVNGHHTNAGVE
jgi:hypothetical protein